MKGSLPGGGAWEIVDFEGDRPRYRTTLNVYAGISVGANLLWPAPYSVRGGSGVIGLWDASGARASHQEFGGRVTVRDGSSNSVAHSSHVAGTLCAGGVVGRAIGMAPGAKVDSYDWNNDISEMTARGASYPGEPGTIYISSHSYVSAAEGWVYTTSPVYTWAGTGSNASGYEDDFGKYDTRAAGADALAYSLPYYLMFWAAGNDRTDNPALSNSVAIGVFTYSYDPALHPPGDGKYSGGYDTISHDALGKNVVTIGSVATAESGGIRDPQVAVINSFASWGPADDGRIKPDLVAKGSGLYSCANGTDSAYVTMSGTSMATPGAAGAAQLLVHYLSTLFTNTAMRASTLKALLIHTADDCGRVGPDYTYGWGLVSAKAAADVLKAYQTNSPACRVVEDHVATNRTSMSYSIIWDGASPIRATLSWTDPAGASTASHNVRTPTLVNNLDLRVIGPGGAVYAPWVMPFVGNWTTNTFAASAATGSNYTDNVEQVLVASPGTQGVYSVRVTYAGALANGDQPFSLVITGGAGSQTLPAPQVATSSPGTGSGTNLIAVTGERFALGSTVRLVRPGLPDVTGTSVEALGNKLDAQFNTTGMSNGWWHLLVANPDGQQALLYNAFRVGPALPRTLWREEFAVDAIAAHGWAFLSTVGSSQWALSSAKSVTPAYSLFSPASGAKSDTSAVTAQVAIPRQSTSLSLTFWHDYDLELLRDGGVLEFSLDGGAFFDVASAGSGATVSSGGYVGVLLSTGKPSDQNPLSGRSAWTGTSLGFTQVVVELTDSAKYAGHRLCVRWRLGTNNSTSSAGWFVDDVTLSGIAPPDMTRSTILSVR